MGTKRRDKILSMFGKQLKLARERAEYKSAQAFAETLGIDPHTYRHYERGEAEPNFETLTRICELLDVTPNDLLVLVRSRPSPPVKHPTPAAAE